MGVQVDLLTRGDCHSKEFIDFEFDGKHISEFGLVAVNNGDRHSFTGSPDFEDETSEVEGVSGQYYWGTRYKPAVRSFSLATDGMTEEQVNAFKQHFRPGKYGKFIEDKLAHRYGWARISQTVQFTMVPFKKIVKIRGIDVEANEYKGEGSIVFVFDEPFMYATENVLPVSNDPNDLRAMYNNGTPMEDSWDKNYYCYIGSIKTDNSYDSGALKNSKYEIVRHSGTSPLYFYNPSTVPTKTKITMSFSPTFSMTAPNGNNMIYFTEIADTINKKGGAMNCNTISMTQSAAIGNIGEIITNFYYTSPNVIYDINKAIQLAANFYINNSQTPIVSELEELLRLEIINSKVVSWAMSILRIMKIKEEFYSQDSSNQTGCFLNGSISVNLNMLGDTESARNLNWLQYFNIYMLCMLADCSVDAEGNFHLEKATWSFQPYTITFDGEKSETTMNYSYNQILETLIKFPVSEENCGDMICSPYLKLDGGDILDENKNISSVHTLQFKQGTNASIFNEVSLEYKYTYL